MIGICAVLGLLFTALAASMPEMSGRFTSIKIKSGFQKRPLLPLLSHLLLLLSRSRKPVSARQRQPPAGQHRLQRPGFFWPSKSIRPQEYSLSCYRTRAATRSYLATFTLIAGSLAFRLLLFWLGRRLRGSSSQDREDGQNLYARIFGGSSRNHLSGYLLCAHFRRIQAYLARPAQ